MDFSEEELGKPTALNNDERVLGASQQGPEESFEKASTLKCGNTIRDRIKLGLVHP